MFSTKMFRVQIPPLQLLNNKQIYWIWRVINQNWRTTHMVSLAVWKIKVDVWSNTITNKHIHHLSLVQKLWFLHPHLLQPLQLRQPWWLCPHILYPFTKSASDSRLWCLNRFERCLLSFNEVTHPDHKIYFKSWNWLSNLSIWK